MSCKVVVWRSLEMLSLFCMAVDLFVCRCSYLLPSLVMSFEVFRWPGLVESEWHFLEDWLGDRCRLSLLLCWLETSANEWLLLHKRRCDGEDGEELQALDRESVVVWSGSLPGGYRE